MDDPVLQQTSLTRRRCDLPGRTGKTYVAANQCEDEALRPSLFDSAPQKLPDMKLSFFG